MDPTDVKRTFVLWVLCSGYIGWVFSEISLVMAIVGVAVVWIVWLGLILIHVIEKKSDKENILQTAKHLFSRGVNS